MIEIKKIDTLLIFLILFRFFFAYFTPVSGDETWHLSVARYMAKTQYIPFIQPDIGRTPFWPPPLFHIISAILYYLGGDILMSLLPPLLGALTIFLTYKLANFYLKDKTKAKVAALFVALNPLHIYFSGISYIDIAITFAVTLSAYAYLIFLNKKETKVDAVDWYDTKSRKGRARRYELNKFLKWLLLTISLSIALWTKYSALFLLPTLVIHSFVKSKKTFMFVSLAILFAFLSMSLWYWRNWILLDNPVWHMLFGGKYVLETPTKNIMNLINPMNYVSFYVGFWGILEGDLSYIFRILMEFPLLSIAIYIWLFFTIFLSLFVIKGLVKADLFMKLWLLFFVIMQLLAGYDLNYFFTRLIMPAIVVSAVSFASTFKLNSRGIYLLSIISVMFIAQNIATAYFLDKTLDNRYSEFFNWSKANVKETDTIFYSVPEYITYYLQVPSVTLSPVETAVPLNLGDYETDEIYNIFKTKNVTYLVFDDWTFSRYGGEKYITLFEKVSVRPDLFTMQMNSTTRIFSVD